MSKSAVTATALALLFALAHLAFIHSFDLGVDEAHYGLYALNPDWGYYDHPPMVGWILIPSQLIGQSDIGLRMSALIIMLVNSTLLYVLSKHISHSNTVSLVALMLFYLGVIVQMLGWNILPDTILMTWTLLIILTTLRLRKKFCLRDWILLGLFIGFAGLSKYTAIVIVPALALWLFYEKQLRLWLAQPGLWLAVVIAFVCILPVLYWNYQHDWISLSYQFNHATAGSWSWADVGYMQIAQALLYSPLLYFLGLLVLATTAFNRQKASRSDDMLLVFLASSFLGITAWASGNGNILPHWAGVGWLVLTPLCAKKVVQGGKILLRVSAILAALSTALVLLVYIVIVFKPVQFEYAVMLYRDVMGWREAAQHAVNLAHKHTASHLWVANWTHASRIAWYSYNAKLPIQVIGRTNQFDLWNGRPAGERAILITTEKKELSCNWLQHYDHYFNEVRINRFWYYLCE